MARAVYLRLGRSARCGPALLLAFVLSLLGGHVGAQAPTAPGGILRVAVIDAPPFAVRQGDSWGGFSVELWRAIGQRLGVETRFVDLGNRQDVQAQVDAVREGRADVGIAAIAVTPQRDAEVDFTVSYLDTGLQIAIDPRPASLDPLPFLSSIPYREIGLLFLSAVAIMLVLAHLLWLMERRHEPAFQRGYLRSIGEGLWVAALIIATGEYGDRATPRIVKRVAIAGLWILGVILIAQFTATLTASLTVDRLQAGIAGPQDLPGKRIATAPRGPAATWLGQQGLPYQTFNSPEAALRMLETGATEAIVFDAPTLRYYSKLYGQDRVTVVGPIFQREKFAFAVARDSPLRKRINAHFLTLVSDGEYDQVYRRWFTETP